MKKLLSYLSASLLAAFLIVVIVSQTSWAEEIAATDMNRLATVLENMLVQKKVELPNPQTMASAGIKNPTCMDNYKLWKKSTTYKSTAKWNVDFIPYSGSTSNASLYFFSSKAIRPR